MKIALFGGYAPSLINFRGPLIRAMLDRGHDVVALAPPHSPSPGPELEAMGAQYREVPLNRRGLNPLNDLASLFSIKRILQDIRPDALLSYTIKPVVYGSLAAKMAGVPNSYSMITGLGYAFVEDRGLRRRVLFNLVRGLYAAGLRSNRAVLFQNPDDLDFFSRLGVIPAGAETVITNGSGVDLDHYAFSEPPDGPPVFLCLSRLIRSKGVGLFADAAMRLKKRHPEAVFRIAGAMEDGADGVTADEIRDWKRDGAVEILDPVEDVRPLLAGCTAYVLPTYYREGVPRSILEALSTGRAIITTDAPGCRLTVAEDNGLLVPPRDADALESAMETLITDPEKTRPMGLASRRLAEDRFDVNRVNQIILETMGAA
ncbi:glycosyltransferase family 4 protein [Salidesulfovibrio brasiliensis]|uniref:glycosyltransferase family 4 protein n=1 Tax=Salidesulfovibrio brasiliensis TaxID=221711 RepID=UPI0006D1A9BC|nr:glycosyltransferase family 4 protein [Salidesulfovibrio brasiliensis]